MANEFLSAEGLGIIAKEAAYEWKNNNTFLATATREYDRMFDDHTYHDSGNTVYIRLPNVFLTQEGDTVTAQDVKEASLPITLEDILSVPVSYTTTDLTTKVGMQNWKNRILYPAMRTLSSKLNAKIAQKAVLQVANYTGDPAANINSYPTIDDAGAVLDELANSRSIRRYCSLAVRQAATARQAPELQNGFTTPLNKEITLESQMGRLAQFDMFADQSIAYHTTSTADRSSVTVKTTVSVSGATSIVMTGFPLSTSNVVVAGDVFEIADCLSVNPITKDSTGQTRKFVATANANSDGSGDATISVQPAIIFDTANARYNVNSAPAATKVVTFKASHHANMAWSQDGLCVVCPKLVPLDSPYSVTIQDPDTGYALRVSKEAQVLNNVNVLRIDVLYGILWLNDRATRILSL